MDFVLNYIELQSIRPPHVSRDEYRRFVLKKKLTVSRALRWGTDLLKV